MSHASDAPNANSDEYNLTELYGYYSVNDTLTDLTFTDVFTEELANVLNVYFSPALIFMGIIGNVLSITVFFKSKLRGQSTSQYLSALAISDTLFLLQLIPPWLKAVRASRVFARDGFCQTFVYFSYVSSAYSSWLVVAFTVERCVAVLYPLRRARMCTVRRARTLIAAVAACCLAVNTPVLLFAVPRGDECNIDCELMEHAARFNVVDTIFSFTLPLTIITVLNIWIMIGVCRLSRARGHLIKDESKSRPRGARRATREHAHLPGRRTRSTLQRSQQRITRMLLIVSSVFVVLNLPAYSMRIVAYANNMSSHEYSGRWAALQQICLLFFNANFGINFFLYCMTGQNFRRALCQTFPCINSIRNVIKSVCCRGPEQHDAPAPPRSSLTNSLSINTEATLAAAASRVRLKKDINGAKRTGSCWKHGTFLKVWPFDSARQQQQRINCELQVYPIQSLRLLPGARPVRPVAREYQHPVEIYHAMPTDIDAPRRMTVTQTFKPIQFLLVPGELTPCEPEPNPLSPKLDPSPLPPYAIAPPLMPDERGTFVPALFNSVADCYPWPPGVARR